MICRLACFALLSSSPLFAQDVRVLTLDANRTSSCASLDYNIAVGNVFSTVRGHLLDPTHFGAGGTVGRAVVFTPSVLELTPAALVGADVVLLSRNQVRLRTCEILDLAEFVRQGGGLFAFQNGAGDMHASSLGAVATSQFGSGPATLKSTFQ